MKTRLSFKFALKNIKANKLIIIPFIISVSIMMALLFIMASLSGNHFVLTRHSSLSMIINFGIIIIMIFAFMFILYANRFLIKRRSKEFALYRILGLEKRHIRKIIFVEEVISFLIIFALSIISGYLVGKILFLLLSKIMNDMSSDFNDYYFSVKAFKLTGIYTIGIFTIIYIINIFNIKSSSPMELLSKGRKSESQPKAKILYIILGLISLFIGYFIALKVEGRIESLGLFFIAALFVIVATYLLFMYFSIGILKLLKKKKNYYYKAKNFISVSGMLYRMKSNAVSIASITVLSTAVIITISATASIYLGIDQTIDNLMPTEYSVSYVEKFSPDTKIEDINKKKKELKEIISSIPSDIIDDYFGVEIFTYAEKVNHKILPATSNKMKSLFTNKPLFLNVLTLDSYNKLYKQDFRLEKNEILLTSNAKRLLEEKNLQFMDKNYDIRYIEDRVSSRIAADIYYIVVADYKELTEFAKYYKTVSRDFKNYFPSSISISYGWNVKKDSVEYEDALNKKLASYKDMISVESKKRFAVFTYEMNGGFLFLGMIIGFTFMLGAIMIIFYKQISEGYDDRKNFQIMKSVGLPDTLIKKTLNTQIIWIFILPLIISLIHSLFASKIVFQLTQLFGVKYYGTYAMSIGVVSILFTICYLIVYKITSTVYYNIVN